MCPVCVHVRVVCVRVFHACLCVSVKSVSVCSVCPCVPVCVNNIRPVKGSSMLLLSAVLSQLGRFICIRYCALQVRPHCSPPSTCLLSTSSVVRPSESLGCLSSLNLFCVQQAPHSSPTTGPFSLVSLITLIWRHALEWRG